MKTQAFIFSKNRACQLRLLLESFAVNCPDLFQPYILYKSEGYKFDLGYETLKKETLLPDIVWERETQDIKTEFLTALEYAYWKNANLTCIFTDDCVFYRETGIRSFEISHLLHNYKDMASFSFRLGLNTIIQDYQTGRRQKKIEKWKTIFSQHCYRDKQDEIISWDRNQYHDQDNYNYVFGMDGCCFRSSDLYIITNQFEKLNSFRDWEGCLSNPKSKQREGFNDKHLMSSPIHSAVINNAINSSQSNPCPAGTKHFYSLEELNDKYLNGEVIDLNSFDFSNVQSCHWEFPLKFRKL